MKPSPFDYAKPSSLDEALGLLGSGGGNAVVLAGGQSLMPTLNMRLSSPTLLVDINDLQELEGINVTGDVLRIGALTRHKFVERSTDVVLRAPPLAACTVTAPV